MKIPGGFFLVPACFLMLFLSAAKGFSFTIDASVNGTGGTISPTGSITVPDGGSQQFIITPDQGYDILDVAVDAGSVGAVSTYTFNNVTADHSITAFFQETVFPSASFIADPASTVAGAPTTVQFTDTSTGNPTSYFWEFGDGLTSTEQNPMVAYYQPGTYPVTLTVANALGSDSIIENYIVATCGNQFPVKLGNDGSYFDSIMAAYDSAYSAGLTNIRILVRAENLPEQNLNFYSDIAVTLEGGYDCSFLDNKMETALPGSLTIAGGSVTLPSSFVLSSPPPCAFDVDNDGFTSLDSCSGTANDCDDNDANVYPGAPEICDGNDNNCNNAIDEGLTEVDADGDGYTSLDSCGGSMDDCDDTNAAINPGAIELYGDGIDQNCDGVDVASSEDICFTCHLPETTTQKHTRASAPNASCADCHAGTVANILPGHYGIIVKTAGNNMAVGATVGCRSCHDLHNPDFYVIPGPSVVWPKVLAVGKGNETCDTCHGATNHDSSHNNRVIDPTCAQCHTSDTTVLGQPGTGTLQTQTDVDALHRSQCATCHNYTTPTYPGSPEPAIVAQAIQDGSGASGAPISCTACHTNKMAGHAGHDATSFVWDGNCNTCHTDNGLGIVAGLHNGTCTLCHDNQYGGRGTAILGVNGDGDATLGAALADFNTAACTTCHPGATYPKPWIHHDAATAISGNCVNCHNTTTGHAANHTAMASLAANCAKCHSGTEGGLDNVPVDAANNKVHDGCTSCHTINPTTKNVVLIDPATSPLVSAMPDGGTVGGTDGGGNCEACHGATYFPNHSNIDHGTSRVTVNATCASCHDALAGGTARNAIASPFTGTTEVHAAAACSTCHQADGNLVAATAVAPGIAAGGGDCATCHGTVWNTTHQTVNHTAKIVDTSNCTRCHTATAGTASGAPVDPANTMVHDSCATCHDATTGSLLTLAAANDPATPASVTAMAAGDCNVCHGAYFQNHQNASHALRVADTANCNRCHSGTAGTVSGVPVSTTDDKVHDSCASCHDTTNGLLLPITAPGGNSPIAAGDCNGCHSAYFENHASANHLTNVGGTADCINCHTATAGTATEVPVSLTDNEVHDSCASCHNTTNGSLLAVTAPGGTNLIAAGECIACHDSYFTNHNHHNTTPPNDVTFNPAVDTSQPSVQPCSDCHHVYDDMNSTNIGLSTFTAIVWQHDVLDGVVDGNGACQACHSYTGGKSADPIAVSNAISSGSPATCATCHTDKVPDVGHGLHDATTFGWDGNCNTCHTDNGLGIVAGVHKNTCTLCHNNSGGGPGTAIVGVNGDGDATLGAALADFTTAACTTCHPGATYPEPWIHHDTATATSGSCGNCHNSTTGHAANHTAMASLAANCAKCHTGTEGGLDNVPVDAANNKLHDGCTSCHTINPTTKNVVLIDPATSPLVSAMPDGGTVGGTDGGGNCEACHGAYFPSHSNIDHATSLVTVNANCATCHDAVAGGTALDAITSPFTGTTEVHAAASCSTCHQADGNLVAPTTLAPGIAAGGGDCATCHGTDWGTLHTTAPDHSGIVTTTGTDNCASCHASALVDASTHTGCAQCHDAATGALLSLAIGKAAPGNCQTCHITSWEALHTAPTAQPNHSSAVAGSVECTSCHDATAGTATGVPTSLADNKVHDNCAVCHNPDGTLKAAASAGADGAATCADCHGTDWGGIHTTAPDHSGIVTTTGTDNCASCHASALVDASTHTGCAQCHDSATGALVSLAIGKAAPGNCQTCHITSWEALHTAPTAQPNHSSAVAGIGKCTSCHDTTAGTAMGMPISLSNNLVHDNCGVCHNVNGSLNAGASPGADGLANCADCHASYDADFANGHLNEDHGNVVAVSPCNSCHTGSVIGSVRIHNNNCFTSSCHASSTDGTLTNAAAGHTVGTPSDCTSCHGAAGHNTDTDHNRRIIAWGNNQPDDLVCSSCHSSDNTNVGQAGTGTLASQADVDALHDKNWDGTVLANQCELCHWYNASTQAKDGEPTQAKVDGAIAAGKAGTADATCITCHDYNRLAANHGGHTPADFGWSPSCGTSACHNETGNSNIVASPDVHNNQCGLCHVNPGGGGTLRSYAVGKTISEATTCETCHGTNRETIHHVNAQATAGNCTWCHADPRPGWPGTAPNPIPTQLFCIKCHVEPSGTGLVVYRNSYTPVNVSGQSSWSWDVSGVAATVQTPVHTITHTAKIDVQNYGACLGCHDGNTPGAAQIQVWHAAPLWVRDGSSGDNNLNDDTSGSTTDDAFDVLRNAPGRSYYANGNTPPRSSSDSGATERRYNIFATGANTGGVEKVRMYGRYWFGESTKPYKNTNSENRAKDDVYSDYRSDSRNPWVSSPWPNRLRIPRNSFNNPEGLMTSDPYVPLP